MTIYWSAGMLAASAWRRRFAISDSTRHDFRPRRYGRRLLGYLEFHIEQGPVLDTLNLPLGVVTAIVGQSRCEVTFRGEANHAGTTPMHLRRDALAAAARWTSFVERTARATPGVVATVGALHVHPGAANVVPGEARRRSTSVMRMTTCATP